MPATVFDLLLLGYRNDLARERVLAYLRDLPEEQGGAIVVERDAELPRVLHTGIDDTTGLRLVAELRDRGAQVRLVSSASAPQPTPRPIAPPPSAPAPARAGDSNPSRLLV